MTKSKGQLDLLGKRRNWLQRERATQSSFQNQQEIAKTRHFLYENAISRASKPLEVLDYRNRFCLPRIRV